MQRLLFFAVLLLSLETNAYTSGPVDTVKTADDKILFCSHPSDVGRMGYRPNLPLVLSEQGDLRLTFAVLSMRCRRSLDKGFEMELAPLFEPSTIESTGLTIHPRQVKAVITSQLGRVLTASPLEDKRMQIFSLPLDLRKILKKSELAKLDDGQSVKVRLQYFHLYQVAYEGLRQRERGTENGGAYYFYFDIQKDSQGEILASEVFVGAE